MILIGEHGEQELVTAVGCCTIDCKLCGIPNPEATLGRTGIDAGNIRILNTTYDFFVNVNEYPVAILGCKCVCILKVVSLGIGSNSCQVGLVPCQSHGVLAVGCGQLGSAGQCGLLGCNGYNGSLVVDHVSVTGLYHCTVVFDGLGSDGRHRLCEYNLTVGERCQFGTGFLCNLLAVSIELDGVSGGCVQTIVGNVNCHIIVSAGGNLLGCYSLDCYHILLYQVDQTIAVPYKVLLVCREVATYRDLNPILVLELGGKLDGKRLESLGITHQVGFVEDYLLRNTVSFGVYNNVLASAYIILEFESSLIGTLGRNHGRIPETILVVGALCHDCGSLGSEGRIDLLNVCGSRILISHATLRVEHHGLEVDLCIGEILDGGHIVRLAKDYA